MRGAGLGWAELEAIHSTRYPSYTIPTMIDVPGRMWLYGVIRVEP